MKKLLIAASAAAALALMALQPRRIIMTLRPASGCKSAHLALVWGRLTAGMILIGAAGITLMVTAGAEWSANERSPRAGA